MSSVAGGLIAVLGLVFITGGVDASLNIGELLTLFCAMSVAMQIVFVDRFLDRSNGVALSIGQMMWGALITMAVCLFTRQDLSAWVGAGKDAWIAVIYTGAVCTAAACSLQIHVQKYVNPTSVALIMLFEPVFALLFALIVPGPDGTREILTVSKAAGALLIIAGAAFSELDLLKRRRPGKKKRRR